MAIGWIPKSKQEQIKVTRRTRRAVRQYRFAHTAMLDGYTVCARRLGQH
jgi:hypothetical protein